MSEPIFVYFDSSLAPLPDFISGFFASQGLPVTIVDINEQSAAREAVMLWTDGRRDVFPVVRLGDKIRTLLFHPAPDTLSRMFESASTADAEPLAGLPVTVLSADWCPDCRRLEAYFDRKAKSFAKINIETTPGAPEKIMRWSGGRRVVPTIRIGNDILFFNPPTHVIGKFLGIE